MYDKLLKPRQSFRITLYFRLKYPARKSHLCGTTLYLDCQLSLCFWSGRISCKRYDSGKNVLDIHWTFITTFFFTRRLFHPTLTRPDVIANLRTSSCEMCNFSPYFNQKQLSDSPLYKILYKFLR